MPGIVGNYRFYPFTQGYLYKKTCVGIVLDKKHLKNVWLFSGILDFFKEILKHFEKELVY